MACALDVTNRGLFCNYNLHHGFTLAYRYDKLPGKLKHLVHESPCIGQVVSNTGRQRMATQRQVGLGAVDSNEMNTMGGLERENAL